MFEEILNEHSKMLKVTSVKVVPVSKHHKTMEFR